MTKATIKQAGKAGGDLAGQRHERVGGKTAKPKRRAEAAKPAVKGSQKKPRRGTERSSMKLTKDQSSPLREARELAREEQHATLSDELGAGQHRPEDIHGRPAERGG